MKKRFMTVLFVAMFVLVSVVASSAKQASNVNDYIDFTPEQVAALGDVSIEHSAKMQELIKDIEAKFEELVAEAGKDDAADTPRKLKRDPKKMNKLIKEIGTLTGDVLKAKVEYLLKAKNILTLAQKKKLIADLELNVDFFENESPFFFKIDDLSELLDLNSDQVKKILKYRTDMRIKELKLKLDVANQVVDIKDELARTEKRPEVFDKKIMKIADLGAKLLDNRLKCMIVSKDVLTVPQRQELFQLILLNMQAFTLME